MGRSRYCRVCHRSGFPLLIAAAALALASAAPREEEDASLLQLGTSLRAEFTEGLSQLASLREEAFAETTGEGLKLAYVVMVLTFNADVALYLQTLRSSLAAVATPGSRYHTGKAAFVAMIPSYLEGSSECLRQLGFDDVVPVPALEPCPGRDIFLGKFFSKLHLWNMTQYDRVVLLDSDMVVLQNIEELFQYSTFAATHDWPRGYLGNPKCKCLSKMCQNGMNKYNGGHKWGERHEWVKEDRFLNTGLLVVQPDAAEFRRMSLALTKWNLAHDRLYDEETCQPSEQRFLGDYFHLDQGGEGWFPLPAEVYNARLTLVLGAPQLLTNLKVLHYIGGNKPHKRPQKAPGKGPLDGLTEWFFGTWHQFAKRGGNLPQCTRTATDGEYLGITVDQGPQPGALEPAELLGLMTQEDKARREEKCGPSLRQ